MGVHISDWSNDQIQQVTTMLPYTDKDFLEIDDDKECITSPYMVFDVKDSYAFDIDETVDISFDIDLSYKQSEVLFQYDMNGNVIQERRIVLPKESSKRWYHASLRLNRARFSGRSLGVEGLGVGDFRIRLPSAGNQNKGGLKVCNIKLTRSYKSPEENRLYGFLNLNVSDEMGEPVAARVGIYDSMNRMPLLDSQALKLPYFENSRQEFILSENRIAWPHSNRRAFYINQTYQKRLPVGTYHIVVSRGLEYQFATKTVEIEANKESVTSIKLSRFLNMPAKGWYSGDPHIHVARPHESDNKVLLAIAQAEDLHVANIMQMGNVAKSYYHQYAWGKNGQKINGDYALVPGQEDPRTRRMGHTLHLNLKAPVRNPKRYYLYNEVFDAVHSQGGLSGYAHGGFAGNGWGLDLPFGIIDFMEILEMGTSHSERWFKALNLGYKISPTSGSDYPHQDQVIGSVRTYVQTGESHNPQAWFDGLKAGMVFVTNGPLLSLAINGQGIGSELNVDLGENIVIEATAYLNPDIDQLEKLELIQQGTVIAEVTSGRGEQKLKLIHKLKAIKGAWFVVRAAGKKKKKYGSIMAYSAPIYMTVDDSGWCDTEKVPSIVQEVIAQLEELMVAPVEKERVDEPWDSEKYKLSVWPKNKNQVSDRINEALNRYDKLVDLAKLGQCI